MPRRSSEQNWDVLRTIITDQINPSATSAEFTTRLKESKDVISSCQIAIQNHDREHEQRNKTPSFLRQKKIFSTPIGAKKFNPDRGFVIPGSNLQQQNTLTPAEKADAEEGEMHSLLQTLKSAAPVRQKGGQKKKRAKRASVFRQQKGGAHRGRSNDNTNATAATTAGKSVGRPSTNLAKDNSFQAQLAPIVGGSPPSTSRNIPKRKTKMRRGSTFTPQMLSSFGNRTIPKDVPVDLFAVETASKDIDPLLLNDTVKDAMSKYKHLALMAKLRKLSAPTPQFLSFEANCHRTKEVVNSMEDELREFEKDELEKGESLRELQRRTKEQQVFDEMVVTNVHEDPLGAGVADNALKAMNPPLRVQATIKKKTKQFVPKFHPVLVVLVKKNLPVPTAESKSINIRNVFTNSITHDYDTFRMLCESSVRRFHYLTEEKVLKNSRLHRIFYQEGKFIGPIHGKAELYKVFNFLFSGRAAREKDRKAKAATVRLLFEVIHFLSLILIWTSSTT